MNILIVKLSAIGDVVQTLPALEALKRTYPESRVTWVVEEAAAGILEGHPLISSLLVSRRKTWFRMLKNPLTAAAGLRSLIRFIRELRRTRYDIAIDFQGLLKSGVIIGLARAGRKIGFDGTRELSYLFLNERLPPYDIERHALQRYLDIARYLGARDPSPDCALPIEREVETVKKKLQAVVGPGRQLVVMNPMARWSTKLWPEGSFAHLADRLIREKKAAVIFTGSPDDRKVIECITALMHEKALSWAGDTSLKELAALATVSDLFITTDTGPMHLAAAAGARVIALFGPTAPWRTGPYGKKHIVVRTGVDCSPCFSRKCEKDVRCMKGITVEEVMRQIGEQSSREQQENR
ncbi:MAG TPA: lipopolysaccharide heptosyltransferase II [Nitrospirota bacterium]|nr:lipopolysaccharide heptosyltransferase II [Nitrospirota bacterium]